MGTLLTKDEILRADDLRLERVEVPEWGGEVVLRTMTGTERDAFEAELVEGREQGGGGVGRINYRNLRARCWRCARWVRTAPGFSRRPRTWPRWVARAPALWTASSRSPSA